MDDTSFSRKKQNKSASKLDFDLIVIGGGITGAGILLDAVYQGLSVLLLEKRDFGWGTSSRSTKLIHGGLRYLKQLEVGLVRETGLERARVYKNAPHLVHPVKMLLPIIDGGELGQMTSSIGLWIYDWLADVAADERRKMLDKEETLRQEPMLREEKILGGGLYYEYRTDDARLVIEVIKTAVQSGGTAVNYAEVVDLIKEDGQVVGVEWKDVLSNKKHEVRAKTVINACGPWVDRVRQLDGMDLGKKRLRLTKGVHLVVPYDKFPLRQACYFDVEGDRRMIFAIPRGRVTYFGTTDTVYDEEIDHPKVNMADVDYLLKAVNATFRNVDVQKEDIESSWVGLRPLIHEAGKGPSELSRKDEIFLSETGLISIAGGKLTGYRMMAQRAVDEALRFLDRKRNKKKDTLKLKLLGGNFKAKKKDEVMRGIHEKYRHLGIRDSEFEALFHLYGMEVEEMLRGANELHHTGLNAVEALLRAEVQYTCTNEMVMTLSDFYLRRSGLAYFNLPKLFESLEVVSSELARFHGYDEVEIGKQKDQLQKELPLSFALNS